MRNQNSSIVDIAGRFKNLKILFCFIHFLLKREEIAKEHEGDVTDSRPCLKYLIFCLSYFEFIC